MTNRYPLLLEPCALQAALDDPKLLIVDLCQPQNWHQLHVPGAVHINPGELMSGIPPAPGKLPELAQLEQLFARIGYACDKHIVAYDDEGGGWAARLLWTLDVVGHQHYSLLNGGLFSWYKEGHPITQEVRAVVPTNVQLTLHTDAIAEVSDVLSALEQSDITIWDARSKEEYLGLRSGSARAGHVPGAVNIDWLELMDRDSNLRLFPEAELRRKLDAAGIEVGQHIITHCQSHHRSALSYFVARLLGHSAQGYHGSWGEWGNLPDTPVQKTT